MSVRIVVVGFFCVLTALVVAGPKPEEFVNLARSGNQWDRVNAVKAIEELPEAEQFDRLALLAGDTFERVRWEVADRLSQFEDPEIRKKIRTVALHRWKPVLARATAARAVGLAKDTEAIADLVACLGTHKEPLVVESLRSLESIGIQDAEALVAVQKALRDKSGLVRAAAVSCLPVLLESSVDAGNALKGLMRDSDFRVRVALVEEVARLDPDSGVEIVNQALADKHWSVRAAGMVEAVRLHDARILGALIDAFAEEKGRLRYDAFLSLRQITGKNLDFDPAPWKEWWKVVEGRYRVEGEPVDPFDIEAVGGVQSSQVYYEIPIVSNRVYFVLDLSGSMRDAKSKGPDGTKRPKIDIVKEEMIRTIRSFDGSVFFNIVLMGSFEDGTFEFRKKVWQRQMVPASPRNCSAAIKFIEEQEPKGWSNVFDTVELAISDPNVDTIFLLSDGGASRGKYVARLDVFRELMDELRYRKVMIHSVETGATKDSDRNLLKKLSHFTRGRFVSMDGSGEERK
jgi:HEAT repeat protein